MSGPTVIGGLADLGIVLRRPHRRENRCPCPWCARARPGDEALSVRLEADHAIYQCFRCGETGRVSEAVDEPHRPRRPRPAAVPDPVPRGFAAWADALWRSCQPISPDDVAGRYLAGRCCAIPAPGADLRWHPEIKHRSGHIGPALMGLVTDAVTGEPRSLHRTWLAADGSGKAAVKPARLLLKDHDAGGCVIRLVPDEEVTIGLAVAEGVETGLSAIGLGYPSWATIDAGNLAQFPVLEGIECLTVVADNDPVNPRTNRSPGLHAAHACARRWAEAGRDVRLWTAPTVGADLNDLVRAA